MSIVIVLAALIGTTLATLIYVPNFGAPTGFIFAIMVANVFAVLAAMMIGLQNRD